MSRHKSLTLFIRAIKSIITVVLCSVIITASGQAPNASFVQDINSACIPLTVSFTNTSSNATSYYWDFGNGNTSTLQSPSNVYLNAGIYDVKLIVTNSGGVSDSIILKGSVRAIHQPVAGYYAQNTSSCLDGNTNDN